MNLGYLLKKIRTERSLTLNEVAGHVRLTPSLLSQIEHNKTQPSLTSLESILKYYRVNLSDFFRQMEQRDVLLQRQGEVESYQAQEGVTLALLASKLESNQLESYHLELQPGKTIIIPDLNSDINGERFVLVYEGEITVKLPMTALQMAKGDSLNFKSHLLCEISNTSGQETASVFINGLPPIF
jgi:transcriptional regulator with XRE-family HTH domain